MAGSDWLVELAMEPVSVDVRWPPRFAHDAEDGSGEGAVDDIGLVSHWLLR